MSDPSPSETLRAAAARIRECSPFVLIAGKRVAVEPLAAWLDNTADWDDDGAPHPYLEAHSFARSILEQP